jgi:hypothetical protein
MDTVETKVCFLLQFLSASAEEQVAFCGDLLPENADDLLKLATVDDNWRYKLYWMEQQGNPLLLLHQQFDEYLAVFRNSPAYPLPEDETILQEILSLLHLMLFVQGNTPAINHFWGRNSLHERVEWQLVRRVSRSALEKFGWALSLPATTLEELLHC